MSAINVKMRCFSHLRQHLGAAQIDLELDAGAKALDLEARVRKMLGPELEDMVFRVAVNQTFVDADHELADGDEVALLPPMQGG